jgi:hypothetical protein
VHPGVLGKAIAPALAAQALLELDPGFAGPGAPSFMSLERQRLDTGSIRPGSLPCSWPAIKGCNVPVVQMDN